jgi:hypothetical protein
MAHRFKVLDDEIFPKADSGKDQWYGRPLLKGGAYYQSTIYFLVVKVLAISRKSTRVILLRNRVILHAITTSLGIPQLAANIELSLSTYQESPLVETTITCNTTSKTEQ